MTLTLQEKTRKNTAETVGAETPIVQNLSFPPEHIRTSEQTEHQTQADLEITIPVHNAVKYLDGFIHNIQDIFAKTTVDYVITIVDYNSTDRTLALAERIAREIESVQVLHYSHVDISAEIRQIWSKSSAKYFLLLDPQMHYNADYFAPLIEDIAEQKADVELGLLQLESAAGYKAVFSKIYRWVHQLIFYCLFGLSLPAYEINSLAISAPCLKSIVQYSQEQVQLLPYEIGILAHRSGFKVHHFSAPENENGYGVKDILRTHHLFDIRQMLLLSRRIKQR